MGGEQIAFSIHGDAAAVKQQGISFEKKFCEGTLDGGPLQKRIRKDPGLKTIPMGLLQKVCLLKGNVLPSDAEREFRRLLG